MARPILKMVGIGDLHLDGPLRHYVENANKVILDDVRSVIDANLAIGYGNVVALLGDLFHSYTPSIDNGLSLLVELFTSYPKTTFLIISGNHDVDSIEENPRNALRHLEVMVRCNLLKNVIVALDHPINLSDEVAADSPIRGLRLLPFPHQSTDKRRLNLMHVEVAGAVTDNGSRSRTEYTPKRDVCLVGHLHTHQVVRNAHYPGTLYQTTFGEQPRKFYTRIRWDLNEGVAGAVFEHVQFAPSYRLVTEVVNTLKEYKSLCKRLQVAEERVLYKVVVNRELVLPDNPFSDFPCVVKTNPFKTESELRAVLSEDIDLAQSEGAVHTIDLNSAVGSWLERNDVPADLQRRAISKLNSLLASSSIHV